MVTLAIAAIVAITHYSPSLQASRPAPCIDESTWIDAFSISKYRPLLRLISNDDAAYVSEHLGTEVGRAYKNLRKTVVRDYLRSLSSDFNQIHRIATAMALRAPDDDGALSLSLVEQKMTFIFHIWTIELILTFGGIIPGRIRMEPMLDYIDSLAMQARELTRPQLSYRVM